MVEALSILTVTNMYPTGTHPAQGVFVEQQIKGLRAIGLPVEVFHVDRAAQGMGVYFRMLKPLAAAVAATRPALLHVMYGGVMADRVTRWNTQCPTIVTFHGSDLLGENLSGRWRKLISHYGVHCSRRAAGKAQGVILVAQRLKPALPAGLDETKVRVIPCGIDLDRFQPMDKAACQRHLGWSAGCFHVLFPSNNRDPVKRPWLAAAAVAVLNGAGVPTELHCLRGVANPEVPTWMNASDALLLTSAHEGSPTVVKEALACGVPVVSLDVGDVAERIEGIAGCHLAVPEPADLAAKLRMVQRTDCRVSAREKMQELSIRNVALTLERFYRETLTRWSQAAAWQTGRGHVPAPVKPGDPPAVNRSFRVG